MVEEAICGYMNAKTANNSQVLLVLGMHRSGTSVVTEMLHELGYDLADDIIEPIPEINSDGFFEDRHIVAFNEELLGKSDATWMDYRQRDLGEMESAEWFGQWHENCLNYLSEQYGSRERAVLKDPRLCRMLPLWISLFAGAGIETSALLVIRKPRAVARSLAHRDGVSQAYAVVLWCAYYFDLLNDLGEMPATICSYENLMDHPVEVLAGLAQAFALDPGESGLSELAQHCKPRTLSPELGDESIPTGLLEISEALYDLLSSSPVVTDKMREQWVSLRQRWLTLQEDNQVALSMLMVSEYKLQACSARTVEIGQAHKLALELIQKRDQQLENTHAALESTGRQHADAIKVVEERDRQLAQTQALLEKSGREHEYAIGIVEERDLQLSEIQQDLDRHRSRLQRWRNPVWYLYDRFKALWQKSE